MSFKTKLLGAVKAVVPKAAPDSPPEAPPPDVTRSSIMLAPGKHVIDGTVVEIPDNGQLAVPFETTRGKHIVDGRVVIAPDMSPSIPR